MDYQAGDVILYRPFGGGVRRVRVIERHADVKHGRPGFNATVVSGPETGHDVWGYDYQIVNLRLVEAPGTARQAVGRWTRAGRARRDACQQPAAS